MRGDFSSEYSIKMNCGFEEGTLRKKQVAIWATVTFGLAWGLFALAMPIYNREKVSGPAGDASVFLLMPFAVQALWFAAGVIYSARRKSREPIVGILLGFGLEFLVLVILIAISASSHY